jgi:hypothetical protein
MKRSVFALALAAGLLLIGVQPATASPSSEVVARYDFDGRSGSVLDGSGHGHTMRAVSRHGARITYITRGGGHAVQFPPKCGGAKCPHVVLQAPHAADLNPGRRPILFGATIRLTAAETSRGQNVLQKGYAARGSQYKLQIDGRMGRPSCAVVDVAGGRIHLAHSSVSVSNGAWHTLQCRRVGSSLTVLVDGQVRGSATVPEKLSIANKAPLSIGGKGVYTDNDQYQGAIDDVWVQIG